MMEFFFFFFPFHFIKKKKKKKKKKEIKLIRTYSMGKKSKEEIAAGAALTKSRKTFWDAMEQNNLAEIESYIRTNPEWVNREDGSVEFRTEIGQPSKFDQLTKTKHRFMSPLQYAAALGMTAMVAMLLRYGADILDASESGYTALGYANLYGHYDAKQLLKEAHRAHKPR